MTDTTTDPDYRLRLAISDPGAFTPRGRDDDAYVGSRTGAERLIDWQTRAARMALAEETVHLYDIDKATGVVGPSGCGADSDRVGRTSCEACMAAARAKYDAQAADEDREINRMIVRHLAEFADWLMGQPLATLGRERSVVMAEFFEQSASWNTGTKAQEEPS
jgi:hypothetical protein